MAYEKITGPLDVRRRGDLQAAIVASTVANANRAKGPVAKPKDFLPVWDKRPKTPEELWKDVLAANTALKGSMKKPV